MKQLILVLATGFFCYCYSWGDELGMFISFMYIFVTLANTFYNWAIKKTSVPQTLTLKISNKNKY